MTETPAEARLRRQIENSWPGRGPCGWLVYSPKRNRPSAIYDVEVTAKDIAKYRGLECVAVVPTLTDAEREAVEDAVRCVEYVSAHGKPSRADLAASVATLRGLLERTEVTSE